jgi:hypothetical protein
MSTHEKAEYQILIDHASNYILDHATAAGIRLLPLQWDGGAPEMTTATHRVRIATRDAAEELRVPHEWLALHSAGHNRFRTEVEAMLARLRAGGRSSAVSASQ